MYNNTTNNIQHEFQIQSVNTMYINTLLLVCSFQSAFYLKSTFYPWSAVWSLQSALCDLLRQDHIHCLSGELFMARFGKVCFRESNPKTFFLLSRISSFPWYSRKKKIDKKSSIFTELLRIRFEPSWSLWCPGLLLCRDLKYIHIFSKHTMKFNYILHFTYTHRHNNKECHHKWTYEQPAKQDQEYEIDGMFLEQECVEAPCSWMWLIQNHTS